MIKLIHFSAVLLTIMLIFLLNPAFAQAKLDPNLIQGSSHSANSQPQANDTPRGAASAQYQYPSSGAAQYQYGQYGQALPDTGGISLLIPAVIVGVFCLVGGGVLLSLLRR